MKIHEARELLNSTYIDWAHILANPCGIQKDSQITWNGRIPKMLKLPVMISDIIGLIDSRQYTFQIAEDGSIIQLYYRYDSKGNKMQSACLAFYSTIPHDIVSPTLLRNSAAKITSKAAFDEVHLDDEPLYTNPEDNFGEEVLDEERSENWADEQIPVSNNRPASWLRIDYDPQHAAGVLHHDCHMHVSAFPYARLVVAGVPTPKQFIEFIIALCYPTAYEKHRLNASGQYINESHILAVNSKCVPTDDHKVFSHMAHFRIPTNP